MDEGHLNSSDIAAAVRERQDFLPVAQARVIEVRKKADGPNDARVESNQIDRDDQVAAFTALGAIDPPYDPEMLALLFEHSNSLRQNVDAYATNIDGFGHRFDPEIDVSAADIDQRIGHAIQYDAYRDSGNEEVPDPTPEEIAIMKKKIVRSMRFEQSDLKYFFDRCVDGASFVSLRRMMRQDLEVAGNAFWEVLRNTAGKIRKFVYVPALSVRLLPCDPKPIEVRETVRVSDVTFEEEVSLKRVRRFVQIMEGRAVFFKEFGDPRLISSGSGMVFSSLEAMDDAEPGVRPATEVLHFKVHSPRSAYGVPRWVGNLLAVLGSRQSEEVNFNYFENKSVPPLAILVSGGRMTQSSVDRVSEYIEANIKGKRNFHKILVLEAESSSGNVNDPNASRMKIALQPLTSAQHSDALFQNYDERNIDKVGQSFRLPRMLRGDIRDFNRSTADAALTFAEVQVFEPERQEFDFVMNRRLLSAMGIRFWRFVSLAPVLRDAQAMSEIVKNFANANVITPEEARELAGDVFNRSFKRLSAKWVKQPGAFTIAGIPVEQEASNPLSGPDQDNGEGYDDPNFGPSGGPIVPMKPPAEGVTASAKVQKLLAKEAERFVALRKALMIEEESTWTRYLMQQVDG